MGCLRKTDFGNYSGNHLVIPNGFRRSGLNPGCIPLLFQGNSCTVQTLPIEVFCRIWGTGRFPYARRIFPAFFRLFRPGVFPESAADAAGWIPFHLWLTLIVTPGASIA